jgi:hypothetical protein
MAGGAFLQQSTRSVMWMAAKWQQDVAGKRVNRYVAAAWQTMPGTLVSNSLL